MFLRNIRRLIRQADFFCSNQLLRYNSDTQYNTVTGGLLSIGIIIVIVIGFASMITDTLNRTSITSSKTTTKNSDPPLSTLTTGEENMFMFSLSIQSYDFMYVANLSDPIQYFDVRMNLYHFIDGWLTMSLSELQPCTQEHWGMLPGFVDRFNAYNGSSWLCLPLNHQYVVQGAFTSPLNDLAIIQIHPCKNKTGVTCAPQADIDQLFADYGNFILSFYYINPVINPNSVQFMDYFLQGNDYTLFSDKIGGEAWVYFSDYSIITDNSIWPYTDNLYKKGCIVEQKAINHPYTVTGDIPYSKIILAKSENSIVYTRQVMKISAVFSYMGGLVGAVTAVLFLIKSYTDSSLEVTIGINIFQQKDSPDQANQEIRSFDFLSYTLLAFYRILKFFGWEGKWRLPQKLESYRNEVLNQLDVQTLLKRLIKLQTCMTHLLTPEELAKIKEKQSITVQTAHKMRIQLLQPQQLKQIMCEKQIVKQDVQKNDIYVLRMVDAFQNTETGMSLNRHQHIVKIEEIEPDQTKSKINHRRSQQKYLKRDSTFFSDPSILAAKEFLQIQNPFKEKE